MATRTGGGRGSVYAGKPNPRGYPAIKPAGPSPIGHAFHAAVHALLHGSETTAQEKARQEAFYASYGQPVPRQTNAGTLFTPATAALDALLHLPGQVKSAHAQAVKIAHPSQQNPPSLEQNLHGLLGGALGIPRGGVSDPHPRMIPRVPKGGTTAETAGDLGAQVREGLKGAKGARKQQDALYSVERGKRAAAAEQAMQESSGRAGYDAALTKLKGELPKIQFGGLKELDEGTVDELLTHIQQHPTLRPYEKVRAQGALLNVAGGKVPTGSQLALMERVFGREVSVQLAKSVTTFQNAKRIGLELLNVPRAVMASFDLSAPFRQGLMAGASHPVMFAKNFKPMVKALASENAYADIMDHIVTRPSYKAMQESGLALTDLGPLVDREEQFMSNFAERIPGVRQSGRAYTGFLNKMRADLFDRLVSDASALGRDTRDPKLLGDISKFVNSATGRGSLGALRNHAVTMNTLFFSPRLLFSRLNFMNPAYYASLDPFVRRQALKAALGLVGTVGTVLTLAKLGGASVNTDPRNADFAKMKVGNTRIDILGGFQQPIRLLAQLASGKIVSSTTGKTLTLGPQGPGKLSRKDIAQRFLEQKLAPIPSLVNDYAKGTDFADKPFSWKRAAVQRMTPLLTQDIHDLQNDRGSVPLDVGGYALAALGIGLQTYAPKPPKASGTGGSSGSYGGGYGSKSPYARNYSGGGSPYAKP